MDTLGLMKPNFLKNRIFWLNFSFWLLFFSYKFYDFTVFMPAETAFVRIALPMFFHIILSYTHYFFILPDLLRSKNIKKYLLKLVLAIAVVMFFQVLAENAVLIKYSPSDYYETFGWARFVSTLWDELSFMIFTGMIKFAVDWFELENKKRELENQKLTAELNYLKAQINPHFLFNTLHNLSYLTQIKSDQATEVIVKLSNIMRYMIYDSNKPKVALSKEINYIKDYLTLEDIRLNNRFELSFDTSEVDEQIEITPLIFIPFVENAFKHGISDQQTENWIKVKLSSTSKQLIFKVENSVSPAQKEKDAPSGFGLKNVERRLVLSYPHQHHLEILPEKEKFSISLSLDLSWRFVV